MNTVRKPIPLMSLMHIQQQILPAVAAIIFNEQGEVLLQHRKDVNQWGIISGHVEFGESVETAILREIKEETNTAAEIVKLIGIYSSPVYQTYRYEQRTVHYVTTYFEAKFIERPDINYNNQETIALRFFSTQQLPAELAQMHPFWLRDALNGQEAPFLR